MDAVGDSQSKPGDAARALRRGKSAGARHAACGPTPNPLGDRSERKAAEVCVLDWVPVERRFDLLRDVDLMGGHPPAEPRDPPVAAHSLPRCAGRGLSHYRHRGWRHEPVAGGSGVLDAWCRRATQLPVSDAIRATLGDEDGALQDSFKRGALDLVDRFLVEPRSRTSRVVLAVSPKQDPWKEDFAFRPETRAPADEAGFRIRRKLRGGTHRAAAARHTGAPRPDAERFAAENHLMPKVQRVGGRRPQLERPRALEALFARVGSAAVSRRVVADGGAGQRLMGTAPASGVATHHPEVCVVGDPTSISDSAAATTESSRRPTPTRWYFSTTTPVPSPTGWRSW